MEDFFGDVEQPAAADAGAAGGGAAFAMPFETEDNPYAEAPEAAAEPIDATGDLFDGVEVPVDSALAEEEAAEVKEEDDEPTFLSIWQEQRRQTLEARQREEKEAQEKIKADAVKWVDTFYGDRKKRIEAAKEVHRAKEQSVRDEFNAVFEHGTIWEQVSKMVNLSEAARKAGSLAKEDKERFRQLLIVLKTTKPSASS